MNVTRNGGGTSDGDRDRPGGGRRPSRPSEGVAWLARSLGGGRRSAPLSEDDLRDLDGSFETFRFPPGSRLFSQGQVLHSISMIQHGEVELYRGAGSRRVVLEILRSGDLLGLVPHLDGRPSPFSARSRSAVTLLRFHHDALIELLDRRPELAQLLLLKLTLRLERTQRRLVQVTSGELRARVAILLLDETDGGPGLIRLPQATLAELLGASRSRVNGILKQFEAKGLVRLTYGRIEVRDPDALRRVAA